MKNPIIIALIIIIAFTISCNKTETPDTTNDIRFTEINKTIYKLNYDSISGTCYDLVFEITENKQQIYTGILKEHHTLLCCDGGNQILTDHHGYIKVFNMDDQISHHSDWSYIQDLSLDNFAGKGEKYIAYRSHSFGDGNDHYHYGWIKIDLSEKQDTLKIINRASQKTESTLIHAGHH